MEEIMDNSYYKHNQNRTPHFQSKFDQTYYDENANGEKVMNAESLNIDTTLNEISQELKPGETLVLDIGNNYFHQTDEIYDTLVMRGYEVRKSFKNGRNQIVVSKKA
jgi:tRNA splicing endonuclease